MLSLYHSLKTCNVLKGSCLINHEKVYIMYVVSLYKISATDSHLLKILTIMNCRYAFYQSLKDNGSTFILCSKSAILVNALLINIVLWKAKSYPLLPFFSGHWPEAICTKGRDGTHWSLTRLCAYIVHTYTCHHIQHNIGKQVCLFIIFPEGGPLLFLQKYVCILMIACVHICNPLVCTVCTHMFWMHLRRWLCLCFHFMNRNSYPQKFMKNDV